MRNARAGAALRGALLLLVSAVLTGGRVAGAVDPQLMAEGQKGVKLFEQGRFEEALSVFLGMERIKASDPEVEGYYYKASGVHDKNAEGYYYKAAGVHDNNVAAWSSLGALHMRKGEADASIAAYTKAISLEPKRL
ncbi:hypothetical protein T484DRAFT_1837425 [Baffinella frigidus]|nr:hypothetical protein T484DRAFT_1837425 [Cryptophyta sp. CCMP2293]